MLRSALVGFALHNGSAPNSVMVMGGGGKRPQGRRAMPSPPTTPASASVGPEQPGRRLHQAHHERSGSCADRRGPCPTPVVRSPTPLTRCSSTALRCPRPRLFDLRYLLRPGRPTGVGHARLAATRLRPGDAEGGESGSQTETTLEARPALTTRGDHKRALKGRRSDDGEQIEQRDPLAPAG